jgi:hypothetical protein
MYPGTTFGSTRFRNSLTIKHPQNAPWTNVIWCRKFVADIGQAAENQTATRQHENQPATCRPIMRPAGQLTVRKSAGNPLVTQGC